MDLKISCLGGAGEIGMNMFVYETPSSVVVADYGVIFSDPQCLGIDSILPDTSYLHEIRHKIRAIIFTHGHEDHIGGAHQLGESFSAPVYSGKFTAALLERKNRGIKVNVVSAEKYLFGDINVTFFPVKHSIPDTFGTIIDAGGVSCMHISDFNSIDEGYIDKKVDCLLLDSTNAMSTETPHTEQDVREELYKIFSERSQGRIFLTTFASNVDRIASAIDAAVRVGRKVVPEGASIERTLGLAQEMGFVSVSGKDLISAKKAYKMKPEELLYIVSGCQGEPQSALYTIASGERKSVPMADGDLLIFSARMIPGNEANVNKIINNVMRRGVDVIQAGERLVHVSGHAGAEELKRVIRAVSPEYFIPIHGEYRHLAAHRKLAIEAGVDKAHCFSVESGEQIHFSENGVYKMPIPAGRVYIDNRGGFKLDEHAVGIRRQIARDGVVVIRLLADGETALETYGFTLSEKQEMAVMMDIINMDTEAAPPEEQLVRVVKKYFRKNLGRRPYIAVSD